MVVMAIVEKVKEDLEQLYNDIPGFMCSIDVTLPSTHIGFLLGTRTFALISMMSYKKQGLARLYFQDDHTDVWCADADDRSKYPVKFMYADPKYFEKLIEFVRCRLIAYNAYVESLPPGTLPLPIGVAGGISSDVVRRLGITK